MSDYNIYFVVLLIGLIIVCGCTGLGSISSNGVTITDVSFTPGQPHLIKDTFGKPIIAAFNRSFVKGVIANNGKKTSPTLVFKVRIYDTNNNFIDGSSYCSRSPTSLFSDTGLPLEPGQSQPFYCKFPEVSEYSPYSLKDYRALKIGRIEAVLNSIGGVPLDSLGGSNEKVFTFNY
jgi:hypothetical protein